VPGNTGSSPAGLLAFSGGLTANTTINDTTTLTTGGITLTNQAAAVGSIWRIRAFGQFVAVSSATARNAEIVPYWRLAQLAPINVTVLVSVAQTTNWMCEYILTATSTTAIWATGYCENKIDYPALSAGTTQYRSLDLATPAAGTVSSGLQTLDLRFAMSVAVATDQWVIQQVTIERLM
jgi:hypothetical protein